GLLDGEIFGHRLCNKLCRANRLVLALAQDQAIEHCRDGVQRNESRLCHVLEGERHALHEASTHCRLAVVAPNLKPAHRKRLGDAVPQRAQPEDCDRVDRFEVHQNMPSARASSRSPCKARSLPAPSCRDSANDSIPRCYRLSTYRQGGAEQKCKNRDAGMTTR